MPSLLVCPSLSWFLFPCPDQGRVQAGDAIVGPAGRAVSVADVDACCICPPRPRPAAQDLEVPAPEPAVAAVLPRHACRRGGTAAPWLAPIGVEPGWKRLSAARVASHTTGERSDGVVSDRGENPMSTARCRGRFPGQYLTIRIPDAGYPAPGAQLLTFRRSRRRSLPHQRQTRRPRRGEPMAPCPYQSWIRCGGRRPAR